ncbi:hypothetical protein CORC01_03317 [Colletotrichum orchidophilum]|uniref:Uncharacterized protein n=1 Tax=Colletotrichum orchidophilum TaxID=1209926 RepID=A0A1G4BIP0_9PEZI|nr:uncharacterized protein CORC01_03317 [Colletotrichum orchidophilum]OHF01284.1 hypothetical protein CORC01_03317 [Colletotrichum orchidophilum]
MARRSGQDRRDQEQRRHKEGVRARWRNQTKLVSIFACNRSPTNPVKGSPGQVGGMTIGPSRPDAGNEDRRSQKRPSLREQAAMV